MGIPKLDASSNKLRVQIEPKSTCTCTAALNSRMMLSCPDDVILGIVKHLSFGDLALLHCVNSRFRRILSRPDPSTRVYGSPSITVDSAYG